MGPWVSRYYHDPITYYVGLDCNSASARRAPVKRLRAIWFSMRVWITWDFHHHHHNSHRTAEHRPPQMFSRLTGVNLSSVHLADCNASHHPNADKKKCYVYSCHTDHSTKLYRDCTVGDRYVKVQKKSHWVIILHLLY